MGATIVWGLLPYVTHAGAARSLPCYHIGQFPFNV